MKTLLFILLFIVPFSFTWSQTFPDSAALIMGKSYFGPEKIKKAFDLDVSAPEVPFSAEELKLAKNKKQVLVLVPSGLSIENFNQMLLGKVKGQKIFYDYNLEKQVFQKKRWYVSENFWTDTTSKAYWLLLSKAMIGMDKDYRAQTDEIVRYLKTQYPDTATMPLRYKQALVQYEPLKKKLKTLIEEGEDKKEADSLLNQLELNRLCRLNPFETVYCLVLIYQSGEERLLTEKKTLTSGFCCEKMRIILGYFDTEGMEISRDDTESSDEETGFLPCLK